MADAPAGTAARWLEANDGVRLRAVHHRPEGARGTVLIFTGRTEYAEKYGPTMAEFAGAGLATVTVDWRGQGLSDRLIEDVLAGHVADFADYQRDVAAMTALARELDLPRPWHLLAHSMGGAIGLRALMEGLPVASAAFSAPMWGITVAPAVQPLAWGISWLATRTGFDTRYPPGTSSKNYPNAVPFESNLLTTDRAQFDWMARQTAEYPDLALGGPSLRWLYEALTECRRLQRRPAPNLPCLTFYGSEESIVDTDAIEQRMAGWPQGALHRLDEARHECLMEGPEIRDRVLALLHAQFQGT